MAGAKALWKRLPTYFPNIKLVLYPLTRDEMLQLNKTGDLTQVRSPSGQFPVRAMEQKYVR